MSLNEQLEQAEQKRAITIPFASAKPYNGIDYPMSLRSYSALRPVDHTLIDSAKQWKDDKESVVGPLSGYVPIGIWQNKAGYEIDDIIAIPELIGNDVLHFNQVPLMVDTQPDPLHDQTKELDFGRMPTFADLLDSARGQEKKDEQVLAIQAADFIQALLSEDNPEDETTSNTLGDVLYNNLAFVRRVWCENDQRYLQLLPYIVFWKMVEGRIQIFVYQRGKGVGEGRLALSCSVGVGGHVNPIDFITQQCTMSKMPYPNGPEFVHQSTGRLLVEGFWGGITRNVLREGSEEVSISVFGTPVDLQQHLTQMASAEGKMVEQYLYDRTTFWLDYKASDVEKHHLAMIIPIELPSEFIVNTNEEELIDVGFVDLEDLWGDIGYNAPKIIPTDLEHWSKAVVNSLYLTMDFLKHAKNTGGQSKFVAQGLREEGHHLMDAEDLYHTDEHARWMIGTIAGSFNSDYRLYANNAFLRA